MCQFYTKRVISISLIGMSSKHHWKSNFYTIAGTWFFITFLISLFCCQCTKWYLGCFSSKCFTCVSESTTTDPSCEHSLPENSRSYVKMWHRRRCLKHKRISNLYQTVLIRRHLRSRMLAKSHISKEKWLATWLRLKWLFKNLPPKAQIFIRLQKQAQKTCE